MLSFMEAVERIESGKHLARLTVGLWVLAFAVLGLYVLVHEMFAAKAWFLLIIACLAMAISIITWHESEWRKTEPFGSWSGHHANRLLLRLWSKIQR